MRTCQHHVRHAPEVKAQNTIMTQKRGRLCDAFKFHINCISGQCRIGDTALRSSDEGLERACATLYAGISPAKPPRSPRSGHLSLFRTKDQAGGTKTCCPSRSAPVAACPTAQTDLVRVPKSPTRRIFANIWTRSGRVLHTLQSSHAPSWADSAHQCCAVHEIWLHSAYGT